MGLRAGTEAFVTAAGQGIGRASALALARAGALVTATDIDAALLHDLAGIEGIRTETLDVTDEMAIAAMAERIGPVDLLFNCAGIVHQGSLLEMSMDDLEQALTVNLRAQVLLAKAFLPGMVERRAGCIINMASISSSVKAVRNRAAYSISKAAVIGLTKSIAADFAAYGVRAHAIAPGPVETPSLVARWHASGDVEAAKAEFRSRQPLGRIGTPEEIADLVVYLAGAEFTTGQVHVIDGGTCA